jgi:hypothetical protein
MRRGDTNVHQETPASEDTKVFPGEKLIRFCGNFQGFTPAWNPFFPAVTLLKGFDNAVCVL